MEDAISEILDSLEKLTLDAPPASGDEIEAPEIKEPKLPLQLKLEIVKRPQETTTTTTTSSSTTRIETVDVTSV